MEIVHYSLGGWEFVHIHYLAKAECLWDFTAVGVFYM